MRRFIFASHHQLAYGLKDTVDFLTNHAKAIYDLNAYMKEDEEELEDRIKNLFTSFDAHDEVIILTDLMGGSVAQKFIPYANEHVHVICGMNLPLALSMVMASDKVPFNPETILNIIEECKKQIIYINQFPTTVDSDDE